MLINGSAINGASINGSATDVRFVAALPPVWIATRYRCYLTGAENGLDTDLELPISSFQTRLRNDGLSYLSCVVNGVDAYVSAIAARSNGKLKIWREYVLDDGGVSPFLMAAADYDEMQISSGGRAGTTGQLAGTGNFAPETAETITLQNPTYYGLSGGKRRYRCELDPRLRPGDTAIINGDTFVVGTIVHIIDVTTTTMEISEA